MPRVLATVDESAKAWVESQSDSLDISEAEVIRRLIDAGRGDESLLNQDSESPANHDSETESDLIQRIVDLENRVGALEASSDTPTDSEGAHGGAMPVEGAEDSDPSPEASSGRVEPPATDDDVRERVEEIAEGWADDDRLSDRVDAAVAAVEAARERGSLGKSEAVDELEPKYPVRGQDGETWWRKNVRPVLRELGEYDSGAHGYRVNVD
jgi:hypothetical protein